ncbi:MAG: pyruvate dehydrogenase (acetyl-transferring), homodimeric type [Phycisphaerales bacterium]
MIRNDSSPPAPGSNPGSIDTLPSDAQLAERLDWLYSLEDSFRLHGPQHVRDLLAELQIHAQKYGVQLPVTSQTPYTNTIPPARQPVYPGNRDLERKIKSYLRWNAMAMVVRANKIKDDSGGGVGGHISTFASSATLYDVGFNHFFRGKSHPCGGDFIYFQGHASPGMYSRAYLEGRLTEQHLLNFRRELADGGGLSSYPHPWLMPDFWEFPTVSMGLGPIMSIYHARFLEYLYDRKLKENTGQKIWAFLGDGETDEPETLGAISLASREKLDNLIWVVNCNLQRLDGPVRGNGQIIQELEAVFRGAGWNVIKVIWGTDWDPLLAQDTDGRLAKLMGRIVDGEYQKYGVQGGAYIRKHFWGRDEELAKLVEKMSDEQLWKMNLGGHDPAKVFAAYNAAVNTRDMPTVILARTIKGYGMGEAGEGKNVTHQQKKLNADEMMRFRDRFKIPITDEQVSSETPFYRPDENSAEMHYLRDRRKALGGPLPHRKIVNIPFEMPGAKIWDEFAAGTGDRKVSTTMAVVRIITQLLKDKNIGRQIVPIIPDEARTFGMEALFRQCGIYSHAGQLYEPVDADQLMYYKEALDGQILEEGINEAGAMSSFIAAGSAYANHHVKMIPFYIYYSMFGYQRVGDLVWAAADLRTRGFMLGGTAGRTTLNGEGLQHEDGHSHVLFGCVPTVKCYDPAFAYEIAILIKHGLKEMYVDDIDSFYYLTVCNENYEQPEMPKNKDIEKGILKGAYLFRKSALTGKKLPGVNLWGSGVILNQVLEAQKKLEEFGVAADVYSVTSYIELRRDALDCERWNLLHPDDQPRTPYITQLFAENDAPIVAASDYMKVLPDGLAKFLPQRLVSLGTDGFGRSEVRPALRDFFEIDARFVTLAALSALADEDKLDASIVTQAMKTLNINPEKLNPMRS